MKRLFYGVAVSALVIGAGGAAMACDQHAHSAALKNPAAATQAANVRGVILAQAQDEQKSMTTDEESKDKSEALPSKAIGPLAQSQDEADKEKAEDGKPEKPEATPSRVRGMVLAQVQQDEQSGTTGQGSDEDSKPDSEEQK